MRDERGMMKDRKALPLWLQRLPRQAESVKSSVKPSSPDAGLQLAIELSEMGWRQIRTRVRQQHPNESERELHDRAYQEIEAWKQVRDRWHLRPR